MFCEIDKDLVSICLKEKERRKGVIKGKVGREKERNE